MAFQTFVFYWSTISVAILVIIWAYFKYSYKYWFRRNVPHLRPKFPLGNNVCIRTISFGIEVMDWYNELKRRGLKYGGAWSWAQPVLVLVDPDYIKDILLKDFSYFPNRDFYHNPKYDPKNESLFVVENDAWRNLRQKLTATFTSAKMKGMFENVVDCSEPMIKYLEEAAKTGDDIDIKEVLSSFTTDVIGCIGFGLEFNSFKNKDAKFRQMGKALFNFHWTRCIPIILTRISAALAQELGISNVPREVTKFFAEIVKNNIEYRRKNNISRSDFTQLLMQLKDSTENQENPFTFDDLVANTIIFFLAGFDTSSTTMHFALYELARNPDMQEKTRMEIESVLNKYNGKFTYEGYQEMTYLRQVIDETLRIYPAIQTLSRVCVKDYNLKNTMTTIEKGTVVVISTLGLGRDLDYYPDPEIFNPERFTVENKALRNPYVYLPFGVGPRNCIGMRFGIMQSSIGLIKILKNFKVSISSKTKMPLTLGEGRFLMQSNETLYLNAGKI